MAVAFSPDSRLLASFSFDGIAVHVWDVSTGESHRTFPQTPRPKSISSLAFSPDGQTLAWGVGEEADRASVRLGELATGRQQTFPLPLGYTTVLALAFAEKGNVLAVAAPRGMLLLDPKTGAVQRSMAIPEAASDPATVIAMAVAPDLRRLATGHGDNHAKLWDTAALKQPLVSLVPGPFRSSTVSRVFFLPDGKSWGGVCSGFVRVWDSSTGQDRGTFAREGSVRIYSAACSADGKTLAAGCGDGSIKLWDLATGRELALIQGQNGLVWTVAFAPDGSALATGGEDFTLRLWDLTKRVPGK